MNCKDHAKKTFLRAAYVSRLLVSAWVLFALFQVTGLIAWSQISNDVVSGSRQDIGAGEDFDYQFTIKDLDGNKFPFDQFKGKVIFLNLWATWCGPCRAEMPGIQKLFEKIDNSKVIFILLSIDKEGDQEKVVSYLEKKKFNFPVYMPSGRLPAQLKVPAIPTTFIISKSGKIERKEVGSKKYNTAKFQQYLEELSR